MGVGCVCVCVCVCVRVPAWQAQAGLCQFLAPPPSVFAPSLDVTSVSWSHRMVLQATSNSCSATEGRGRRGWGGGRGGLPPAPLLLPVLLSPARPLSIPGGPSASARRLPARPSVGEMGAKERELACGTRTNATHRRQSLFSKAFL